MRTPENMEISKGITHVTVRGFMRFQVDRHCRFEKNTIYSAKSMRG